MYLPQAFREDRLEVQHELIRAHPLGLLITHGADGLEANPVPFLLDPAAAPHGVLRAHLARANQQLQTLAAGAECLVVFQGPQHYVSPGWYPSKRIHGKVVPTWNYITVHVWGRPAVQDDAPWLRRQLAALTGQQEKPRPQPWAMDDAPADFVAAQMRAIVGIEIVLQRLEGKWKISQNRNAEDRAGVASGLAAEGADALARLIR